tara:strand:- start:673056 stop:673277 length:222 start_codon:yes stop_codon:yes gene_type:complete
MNASETDYRVASSQNAKKAAADLSRRSFDRKSLIEDCDKATHLWPGADAVTFVRGGNLLQRIERRLAWSPSQD